MKPYFSVIIPTYNRGYIIWKTIQSVQKQIFPNWELLIIDDGSNDNTKQVLAEFQKDPRIKPYYLRHDHVSTARNFGMRKAKSDVVVYVDSDDILFDNFLSVAYEYFDKNPDKVFAVCNYNRRIELYNKELKLLDFNEASSSLKDEITIQDFFHWKVKTCGTGIFHKNKISKHLEWDRTLNSLEDWDYIMQMGNKFPHGFLHIPYALFEYLQKYGGDGICSNMDYGDWVKGFESIYAKHKKDKLMKGQQWYPDRIKKYTKLQKMVDAGKEPPAMYKYFPKYWKK